jgi:hypothetical protein
MRCSRVALLVIGAVVLPVPVVVPAVVVMTVVMMVTVMLPVVTGRVVGTIARLRNADAAHRQCGGGADQAKQARESSEHVNSLSRVHAPRMEQARSSPQGDIGPRTLETVSRGAKRAPRAALYGSIIVLLLAASAGTPDRAHSGGI